MEIHNSAETSIRQQFKAWWKSLWSYIIVLKHPPGNNNSRHGESLFGAT